jgi:hypothetical protein
MEPRKCAGPFLFTALLFALSTQRWSPPGATPAAASPAAAASSLRCPWRSSAAPCSRPRPGVRAAGGGPASLDRPTMSSRCSRPTVVSWPKPRALFLAHNTHPQPTPPTHQECKLTLDTNREPPHMQVLFHDLVAQVGGWEASQVTMLTPGLKKHPRPAACLPAVTPPHDFNSFPPPRARARTGAAAARRGAGARAGGQRDWPPVRRRGPGRGRACGQGGRRVPAAERLLPGAVAGNAGGKGRQGLRTAGTGRAVRWPSSARRRCHRRLPCPLRRAGAAAQIRCGAAHRAAGAGAATGGAVPRRRRQARCAAAAARGPAGRLAARAAAAAGALRGWHGSACPPHAQQTPLPTSTHTHAPSPPPQDVFDLVEAHFAARGAETALAARLEARAQQFRSVQKRLLMRFKVRAGCLPARERRGPGVCRETAAPTPLRGHLMPSTTCSACPLPPGRTRRRRRWPSWTPSCQRPTTRQGGSGSGAVHDWGTR